MLAELIAAAALGVAPAPTPPTTPESPTASGPGSQPPAIAVPMHSAKGVGTIVVEGRDATGTYLWHKTLGYGTTTSGTENYRGNDTIRVADRLSYQPGRADSVRRPGFNGMLWKGEICVGGVDYWPADNGTPGPLAYGARGCEDATANIRVGQFVVGVNPFETVQPGRKELSRRVTASMEDARNQWLKQNGYLGGVRTFQNDLVTLGIKEEPAQQAMDMTPKAIIPSPTDQPKFKRRMQVQGPTLVPSTLADGQGRISAPETGKPAAAPVVLAAVTPSADAKPTVLAKKD